MTVKELKGILARYDDYNEVLLHNNDNDFVGRAKEVLTGYGGKIYISTERLVDENFLDSSGEE